MGLFDLFKRRKPECDPRLIGHWLAVQVSGDPDTGPAVEMQFTPDGLLEYCIIEGDKKQIMKLVYQTDGDQIISNQPSAPREERTSYRFDGDLLVLNYGGEVSHFRRVT